MSGQGARDGPTRGMRDWAACGDWPGGRCDRSGWLRKPPSVGAAG